MQVMNDTAQSIGAVLKPAKSRGRAQALRDSMSAHWVLLRFGGVSLASALVDNVVFYLVYHATGAIAGAQLAGRIVSVFFNYRFVRRAVFFSDQHHRILLPRYLSLVAVNALISYAGIRLLSAITPLGVVPSKVLTETLLFAANFAVQRALIFSRRPLAVSPPATHSA